MNEDYKQLLAKYEVTENEFLVMHSCGITKFNIHIDNFDFFVENMTVSEGEEGKKFTMFMAISHFNIMVGDENINRYYTREENL